MTSPHKETPNAVVHETLIKLSPAKKKKSIQTAQISHEIMNSEFILVLDCISDLR